MTKYQEYQVEFNPVPAMKIIVTVPAGNDPGKVLNKVITLAIQKARIEYRPTVKNIKEV